MRPVLLVLNPHSRRNRGRDRVGELREILGARGEVFVTRSTSELAPILERALDGELACVVSDGGDGSLQWVLNEALPIVERRGLELPVVLPTNGGTIDFVARKAGVRGKASDVVRRLVAAVDRGPLPTAELASLELYGSHADGRPFRRIGFALAAGGVGNRYFDRYYEDPRPGAATIVKVVARTVASLVGSGEYARQMFRPHRAKVWIDGVELESQEHGALHAGAFEVNLGGVFRVFPLAREPGALHFQAGMISVPAILSNLPRLVSGTAIRSRTLRDCRGQTMVIESLGEPLRPVMDGEIYGEVVRLEVRAGPKIRVAKV